MRIRKVIDRKIRSQREGLNVAGDIQGVIAANINEPGTTVVSSTSHNRIVQRSGRRTKKSKEV
ncbi:MAG: hypothetical protein E6I08_04635 [Chloroflexi bacterium]|nr:MAG: hypothetical protein E6I08_04635 [Chloroflexota bacterium]